jgi:hypothetical protein
MGHRVSQAWLNWGKFPGFVGGIFLLLPFPEGHARWHHRDASELNQVTNLGSEYYNDILSYRDPHAWDDIWDQSHQGFRSSAGSLNQKDFLFHQSIKFTSSTKERWRLAYHADRVEEPRRIWDESELELSYGSEQDRWRLGLLGEGQTEKAFVDVGLRLSHRPDEKSLWQFSAWAVDPFYTEKKYRREDYRTRAPWSWTFQLQENWGAATLQARHEQDQAFVWYQVSDDQRYAWRSQTSALRWAYQLSTDQKIFLRAEHDQQSEAVAELSVLRSQDYQDRRSTLEMGQHWALGRESVTTSLWGLWGRTREHQRDESQGLAHTWSRRELAFLGIWSEPLWKESHDQHWGLVVNHVWLDEDSAEEKTEVKFIWGPDFALSEHGRIRFTTTWDLDQLMHDFPFVKKAFHPWGGGQASFLIIF